MMNNDKSLKMLSIKDERGFAYVHYCADLKAEMILQSLTLSQTNKSLFDKKLLMIVFHRFKNVQEAIYALKAMTANFSFNGSTNHLIDRDEAAETQILSFLDKNNLNWTTKASESDFLETALRYKARQFVRELNLDVADIDSVACHIKNYLQDSTDMLERTLFNVLMHIKGLKAKLVLEFNLSEMIGEYTGKDFSDIPLVSRLDIAA